MNEYEYFDKLCKDLLKEQDSAKRFEIMAMILKFSATHPEWHPA